MQALSREEILELTDNTGGIFDGWSAVPGEGQSNFDFVLVTGAATKYDIPTGMPFSSINSIAIKATLLKNDWKYYTTSCVPYARPDYKPKILHYHSCWKVFTAEMARLKPKRVVLMGNGVSPLLNKLGVKRPRFKDVAWSFFNVKGVDYLVTEAPGVISHNPGKHRRFISSLRRMISTQVDLPPIAENYRLITKSAEAVNYINSLGDEIAVDIETTGLDPWLDDIITVSVCDRPGHAATILYKVLDKHKWQSLLEKKKLIMQNGRFDLKFFEVEGIHLKVHYDTMLVHSLIDESRGSHNLDMLAKTYFPNLPKLVGETDHYTSQGRGEALSHNKLQSLARYANRDVDITLRLSRTFNSQVTQTTIAQVLTQVQNTLVHSELKGIKINTSLAHKFQHEITEILKNKKEYLDHIYNLKNANSTKQIAKLLYEDIGLPTQKRKDGKVSTASRFLTHFKEHHPVISDILEYRHLVKVKGTYLKNIIKASEYDGRYHPDMGLAHTETGRVIDKLITLLPRAESSKDPDLGEQYKVRLRELFVADEGHVLIGADYSALEVRIAAILSNDSQLIQDILDGLDIHSVNAIAAFGLDDIAVEPAHTLKERMSKRYSYQRSLAKIATFASLYGGSAYAISEQTGINLSTANSLIYQLHRRYTRLMEWQREMIRTAQTKSYVETPWGRRRRFQFNKGMSKLSHRDQQRQAINTTIQSFGNDINLAAYAKAAESGLDVLFPFHDAIYIQAPKNNWQPATKKLKTIMETVIDAPVPLEVSVKKGDDWSQL